MPADDLLDAYNRFLYLGQGGMTSACRKWLGLSQREFACLVGSAVRSVRLWATERILFSKRLWEKYYRGGWKK